MKTWWLTRGQHELVTDNFKPSRVKPVTPVFTNKLETQKCLFGLEDLLLDLTEHDLKNQRLEILGHQTSSSIIVKSLEKWHREVLYPLPGMKWEGTQLKIDVTKQMPLTPSWKPILPKNISSSILEGNCEKDIMAYVLSYKPAIRNNLDIFNVLKLMDWCEFHRH